MVLGFGEMLDEDRPDESVWLDEPKLLEHFEARQAARGAGKDDDDWSDFGSDGETVQNELAAEMMREVERR